MGVPWILQSRPSGSISSMMVHGAVDRPMQLAADGFYKLVEAGTKVTSQPPNNRVLKGILR